MKKVPKSDKSTSAFLKLLSTCVKSPKDISFSIFITLNPKWIPRFSSWKPIVLAKSKNQRNGKQKNWEKFQILISRSWDNMYVFLVCSSFMQEVWCKKPGDAELILFFVKNGNFQFLSQRIDRYLPPPPFP